MPDRVISVPQATQIAQRIKNKFDNVNGRLQQVDTRVTALENVGTGGSGLSENAKTLLLTILRATAQTSDQSSNISALEAELSSDVTAITLSQNSLTFSGAGTQTLTATTTPAGGTVTWRTSNATVATVNNGVVTAVGNGTAVITASSGNVSATCSVSVSGIAQSFAIMNNLTNCANSNPATVVAEGGSYSATLTAVNGYTMTGATVTVTMGSTDITSTAYSNGTISIANVTGAIVITAAAHIAGILYSGDIMNKAGDTKIGDYTIDDAGILTITATAGNENHRFSGSAASDYSWYEHKDVITGVRNVNFKLTWWHSAFEGYANLRTFVSDVVFELGNKMFKDCTSLVTSDWTKAIGGVTANTLSGIASESLVFGNAYFTKFDVISVKANNCREITILSIPTSIASNTFTCPLCEDVYVAWAETDSINTNNPFGLPSTATFHYGYTGE